MSTKLYLELTFKCNNSYHLYQNEFLSSYAQSYRYTSVIISKTIILTFEYIQIFLYRL